MVTKDAAMTRPTYDHWQWAVTAAFGAWLFANKGMVKSSGILYVEFINRFQASPSETAAFATTFQICQAITAPLAGIMSSTYDMRWSAMVASCVASLTVILVGQVDSFLWVIVFFGAVGLSAGYAQSASMLVLGQYTTRYRSIAFSLGGVGASLGGLVSPFIITWGMMHYGYSGGIMLLAGLYLQTIPAGATLLPVKITQKSIITSLSPRGQEKSSKTRSSGALNSSVSSSSSVQQRCTELDEQTDSFEMSKDAVGEASESCEKAKPKADAFAGVTESHCTKQNENVDLCDEVANHANAFTEEGKSCGTVGNEKGAYGFASGDKNDLYYVENRSQDESFCNRHKLESRSISDKLLRDDFHDSKDKTTIQINVYDDRSEKEDRSPNVDEHLLYNHPPKCASEGADASTENNIHQGQLTNSVITTPSAQEKDESLVTLLTNADFWIVLLAFMFGGCYNMVLMYLPPFALENGMSVYQSSILVSLVSLTEIISRPTIGALMDCFKPSLGSVAGGASICSAVGVILTCLLPHHHVVFTFAIYFGTFGGVFLVHNQPMMRDAVPQPRLSNLACSLMIVGISVGIGVQAPLAGYVKELTGSYTSSMLMIGITHIPSALLLLLRSWRHKHRQEHLEEMMVVKA